MKKIVLLVLFSAIGFQLKAQQNSLTQNLNTLSTPNLHTAFDTIPSSKFSFKPKNEDPKMLFLPKLRERGVFPNTNNLVALLDRMPIVTPKGNWNMPVVKPDGTVIYTMPIKRLQPVVKPQTEASKLNP